MRELTLTEVQAVSGGLPIIVEWEKASALPIIVEWEEASALPIIVEW